MKISHATALLFACCASRIVTAQERVLNPATLRATGPLALGADSADIFMIDSTGTERRIGLTHWNVERLVQDGKDLIRLSVSGARSYVSLLDGKTHAAISTEYLTARDSFRVAFQDGKARGGVAWGGAPWRNIDTVMAAPLLGVAVEHLLGAFDLSDGLTLFVDGFAPWTGVRRRTLRVLSVDRLMYRGEERQAWKVELSAGSPESTRTLWFDQKTGKRLRQENLGMGGIRVVQRTR